MISDRTKIEILALDKNFIQYDEITGTAEIDKRISAFVEYKRIIN